MSDGGGDAPPRHRLRLGIEYGIAILGIALLLGAAMANQAWCDRHFLPVFFLSQDQYRMGEELARGLIAIIGLALAIWAHPLAGRLAQQLSAREFLIGAASVLLAIVLALGTSEAILRHGFARAEAEGPADEEPLRQPDSRLGWIFVPSRTGHARVGGREIAYTIDSHGYRVRDSGISTDFDQPSILFTGESIVAGFGLSWAESIPARTGSLLKLQGVNMATFGYANDQAYMRLEAELPRFRRPVAVVSLFMPSLFVRNLVDDRPHLGADLAWQPGISRLRLHALLNFLVPYHSGAEIDRGIQATRAVLAATSALAREHHAAALIVVPQFGAEMPAEGMIRRRVLEGSGLNIVRVAIDPGWRIGGDLHPDARAAQAIAAAIARHLQGELLSRCNSCTSPRGSPVLRQTRSRLEEGRRGTGDTSGFRDDRVQYSRPLSGSP